MIDQELIDVVQRYIDNDDDLHPVRAKELLDNYCQLIEDNAEMHREIARLNHLNAHFNKQIEQICNEEDEGVEE